MSFEHGCTGQKRPLFFLSPYFVMLAGMLVWELVLSPTLNEGDFLLIPTTRGTRFFSGVAGQRLHTPCLDRGHGFDPVGGNGLFPWSG